MNQAEAQLKAYQDDCELHARDCLVIRDHDTSQLLPLIYRKGQRILHTVAEKQLREEGIVRIMLLKSRRFGGSTYAEGRFYSKSSLNFYKNTFIVGHEEKSTATLFRMAHLMHEQNPIAPSTRASSAQELRFDNAKGTGLKSEYQLATAKNVDAGRSQGIHYLHASEEAFYPDGYNLLAGLFQCLAEKGSEVIRESTANGYGNSFQEDVFEAYKEGEFPYYQEGNRTYAWKNPDFEYVLVFIPWFDIEKYTKDFRTEEEKEKFEEALGRKVFNNVEMVWEESEGLRLKKKYGLTLEQLNWREHAIANRCRGSLEKFRQEYPATVEEAFLSEGANVYPKALCDRLEELCSEPILRGELVWSTGKVRLKQSKHGKFKVWERFDKNESYFLTVDCGGGKKDRHDKENKEPDPTNIDVWNRRTGNQAAQWNGHIDYSLIGDLVELIGNQYDRGSACVEMNNHGYTAVASLSILNYPMYEWKPGEPGWSTNRKTKPLMVDGLYDMARDGGLKINCAQTVKEMRTFVEEAGSFGAAQGCHDDRVDTAGMASQMMTMLPRKLKKRHDSGGGFINWSRKNKKVQKDTGAFEVYVT